MPHFDYHQGRSQAYFESIEPSDHGLYVPKKICYQKFSLNSCFMISLRYLEGAVNYFGR